MSHEGVHYHVEYHWVKGVSLSYTVVALEGGFVLSPVLFHHCDLAPVSPENPERPGDHAVSCQDFDTPIHVQFTVRLLEVQ